MYIDPVSCGPLQPSSSMAPSPSSYPQLSPSPSYYSDEFVTSSLPLEIPSSTLAMPTTITRDTCSNVTVVVTHTVSNSTSRTVVPTANVNAAERIVDSKLLPFNHKPCYLTLHAGITAEGTVSIAVVLLTISIVFFVVIIVLVIILLRRSRNTSSAPSEAYVHANQDSIAKIIKCTSCTPPENCSCTTWEMNSTKETRPLCT